MSISIESFVTRTGEAKGSKSKSKNHEPDQ
jgi:hypothetical protein